MVKKVYAVTSYTWYEKNNSSEYDIMFVSLDCGRALDYLNKQIELLVDNNFERHVDHEYEDLLRNYHSKREDPDHPGKVIVYNLYLEPLDTDTDLML